MWQVQAKIYKIKILPKMSRVKMKDITCVCCDKELKIGEIFYCQKCLGLKMKCFNPTCKCGNIELEKVLKIRCKNCHCSIIYDIENVSLYQQNTW